MESTKIASAGPASFAGISLVLFLMFVSLIGLVTPAAALPIGIFAIAVGAINLIGAVFDHLNGESAGNIGVVFGVLFFVTGAGVWNVVQYFAGLRGWPLDPTIIGWVYLWLGAILLLWAPVLFRAPYTLSLPVALLGVMVVVMGAVQLGWMPASLMTAVAYGFLVNAILYLYSAVAILINTTYQRAVLPLPAPRS